VKPLVPLGKSTNPFWEWCDLCPSFASFYQVCGDVVKTTQSVVFHLIGSKTLWYDVTIILVRGITPKQLTDLFWVYYIYGRKSVHLKDIISPLGARSCSTSDARLVQKAHNSRGIILIQPSYLVHHGVTAGQRWKKQMKNANNQIKYITLMSKNAIRMNAWYQRPWLSSNVDE
jgi:hypothetical protein